MQPFERNSCIQLLPYLYMFFFPADLGSLPPGHQLGQNAGVWSSCLLVTVYKAADLVRVGVMVHPEGLGESVLGGWSWARRTEQAGWWWGWSPAPCCAW